MALDNMRSVDVRIDKANDYLVTKLLSKQGDYNGRELIVQITNGGVVENQATTQMNLGWRHLKYGNSGLDPFQLIDAEKGLFGITYSEEMLRTGDVLCTVQIIQGGKLTETRNFNLEVEESPINKKLMVTQDSFKALEKALTQVNEWDGKFESKYTGLEEEYALELTTLKQETTAQFQQNGVNVKSFGAKGDGVTNDTLAIKAAIASLKEYDKLWIPYGKYNVDDTIIVDIRVDFICEGFIIYIGTKNKPALHFIRPVGCVIEIGGCSDEISLFHGWENDNYVGVVFENAFKCKIDIKGAVTNFTKGVQFKSSGGITQGSFFNDVSITQLQNNRINLEVLLDGVGSWFNSNTFRLIAFTYEQSGTGFQTADVDRFCIKETRINGNTTTTDSNIFNDIRFDTMTEIGGTYTGIHLSRAWAWKFENYRAELVSGENVKAIVLDCSSNQMKDIVFNPVFESFKTAENVKVHLLNITNPERDYTQIYKKTGVESNLLFSPLFKEERYNERYRQNRNDYHTVENVYHYPNTGTSLLASEEKSESYGVNSLAVDNGVNISISQPLVVYLQNLKKGDTFNVNLKPAGSTNGLGIDLKSWKKDNSFIETNDITVGGVKAVVANNTYWEVNSKRLTQAVKKESIVFSVNSDDVGTIAILYYGKINGIEIESNRVVSIVKSIDNFKNKAKKHVVNAKPTKTTNGGYMPKDVVYSSITTVGTPIGWELNNSTGSLVWESLGNY